jgi:PAS domain S-box-containing protein
MAGGIVARVFDDRENGSGRGHWEGLVIERLPLAYIKYDHDVRLLDWNPAAERIFGYTKREAVGQIAMELIVPGQVCDHIRHVLGRIWEGDFEAHSVNENLTKDGRIIECDWFNTPILDSDGKVTGAISLARDVSVRRDPNLNSVEMSRVRDLDIALLERMTCRQREVLRLVARGYRTRNIASELQVSVKTVEMHRAHIMDTIDIHDVPGLTRFAIRVGLVSAYE